MDVQAESETRQNSDDTGEDVPRGGTHMYPSEPSPNKHPYQKSGRRDAARRRKLFVDACTKTTSARTNVFARRTSRVRPRTCNTEQLPAGSPLNSARNLPLPSKPVLSETSKDNRFSPAVIGGLELGSEPIADDNHAYRERYRRKHTQTHSRDGPGKMLPTKQQSLIHVKLYLDCCFWLCFIIFSF